MIYAIYPCPVSFYPSVSFCPRIILPPPPPIILPPGNGLMIFAIYPCPVSSFCPPGFILPPYHFAPWKSFNVHYLPMSHIILPPYHFAPISFRPLEIVSWFTFFTHVPYHFAPLIHFAPIILPLGNGLMIFAICPYPVSFCPLDSFCPLSFCPLEMVKWFTLFTHVPYHFASCIRFRFHTNKKSFTTKAYDRRASADCGTSGLCIYLGEKGGGGALMHVYVLEHIVSPYMSSLPLLFLLNIHLPPRIGNLPLFEPHFLPIIFSLKE